MYCTNTVLYSTERENKATALFFQFVNRDRKVSLFYRVSNNKIKYWHQYYFGLVLVGKKYKRK